MALRTEKISEDIIDSIKTIQSDINGYIFDLGQIHIRTRDIKKDLERISEIQKDIETKLDNKALHLENILTDLQNKYKNGEIDLEQGTVNFETTD